MEFLYKNNTLTVESDKKVIQFLSNSIDIDGLTIDMAGEYEKGGFLAYSHEKNDLRIYQIRIEGNSVGYIANSVNDLSAEELDFLGDLDILIMPTSKLSVPVIEKIEPRLVVTYGELAHELATHMGISESPVSKYKIKESDLSAEKTGCIVFA